MSTNRKSLQQIFALIIAIGVIVGCETDSVKNPFEPGLDGDTFSDSNSLSLTMGDSGITVSGLLLPDKDLSLKIDKSKANYYAGAVLSPTVVSFGIYDMDTTGTTLAPKVQILGPHPQLTFLDSVKVDLQLKYAGLHPNSPENVRYKVLRKDDFSDDWYFHEKGKIKDRKVKYHTYQNGSYALALDSSIVGTVTRTQGGRLRLFQASLDVPPGAVNNTKTIAFQMLDEIPQGLPNAMGKMYEFLPEGTQFRDPVTLSVSFADLGYNGRRREMYGIKFYYFDESTSTWALQQEPQIDWSNERITVELNHFSRYAFAR